ncbi:MAG: hypothetical protein OXG84_16620 [Chloroflexi bacterium]|nr:hypothetical protein [Chloroflexota bacterium]
MNGYSKHSPSVFGKSAWRWLVLCLALLAWFSLAPGFPAAAQETVTINFVDVAHDGFSVSTNDLSHIPWLSHANLYISPIAPGASCDSRFDGTCHRIVQSQLFYQTRTVCNKTQGSKDRCRTRAGGVSIKAAAGTTYTVRIDFFAAKNIRRVFRNGRWTHLWNGYELAATASGTVTTPAAPPSRSKRSALQQPLARTASVSADSVTITWSETGARQYFLFLDGADKSTDYAYLTAGTTSHTFSGLAAGMGYVLTLTADYSDRTPVQEKLNFQTASLMSGGQRGRGSRSVPDEPPQLIVAQEEQVAPSNTPVPPPTNTPVPPPTNTPEPPPPPSNTPVPPPPPTNTLPPPPPPTNTLPPPPPPTNTPVPQQSYTVPDSLIQTIIAWRDEPNRSAEHVERWNRTLAAMEHGSHANPMTAAEAQSYFDDRNWPRWQPIAEALRKLEQS